MNVQIKVLDDRFYKIEKLGGHVYRLPTYQTDGSAAVDLISTEDVTLYPGERKMISTGLAIWIGSVGKSDVAGMILPRSGLGSKGLILTNTIGLIDSDYQGELKISAWNSNERLNLKVGIHTTNVPGTWFDDVTHKEKKIIKLKAGDRIAQMMFIPTIKVEWERVEEFSSKTNRGDGGFGSTDD